MSTLITLHPSIIPSWFFHNQLRGDYYRDPELASFSWRDGERVARPLQHMQMLGGSPCRGNVLAVVDVVIMKNMTNIRQKQSGWLNMFKDIV